jgi:diguanylate cyclase (GGDEF)-like protein
MNPTPEPGLQDRDVEVVALVRSLRELDRRLETLGVDEVNALLGPPEQSLPHRGQERPHPHEGALIDSLPAHIAVLNRHGVIVSVNNGWRQFGDANGLGDPDYYVGRSYLAVCSAALGSDAEEARSIGEGIGAVLDGTTASFTTEYPCHSPSAERWYQLNVIPIASMEVTGAVVMHMDITLRKQAENRVAYLSRIHAMLSGINSLIVRVGSRATLFQEACRIAVETGGFLFARIGILDHGTMKLHHAGLACRDRLLRATIERILSVDGGVPSPIVAQAIADRQAVVANDSEHDPRAGPLGRQTQLGIRSKAAIPIIRGDEVIGVMALYANESQYFHAEEVRLLTQLSSDISYALEHIEKEERLQYYAYFDVLTGLANRTRFLERVAQHLRDAASRGRALALIVIDLERFKLVNDSLGRPAGDVLLRQVAEWLTFLIGDRDLLARIDADHFAIVLPEVRDGDAVAARLHELMTDLVDQPFRISEQSEFRVTAKAGAALFPADGSNAEHLYRNAESALRQAKSVGERYLLYTPRMSEAAANRLALESQLLQALERDEFVLHYQPKVSLAHGTLMGAEALIRWEDPRSGLVPPGKFIPLLEETGLIREVGRWAMAQAIEDYLRWHRNGLTVVPLAVNVSAVQLRDRDFARQIAALVGTDTGAAAGLELEITESVIMEDVNHGVSHLQAIRGLGIRIAIDDFGTGFSSLSYLSRLPVDALKIDRSFIAELTQASKASALVSTIITLAHSLRLKVIAEGVETESQSATLRMLGCDEMQGFLFSRPLPGHVFEQRFLVARQ